MNEKLKIMDNKTFVNGFTSWEETHFEVVSAISLQANKDKPCKVIADIIESQGTGGLYELAEELTDKFEKIHKDRQWDGEFFDAIEAFLDVELDI